MGLSLTLPAQTTRKVLFVGNSYTYYFNLPGMVSSMASASGDNLIYAQSAIGGYSLSAHSVLPATMNAITSGQWDYMVLQEQSQRPSLPLAQVQSQFYPATVFLDSTFHHHNASGQTVMYMTWGRENGDSENCATWPPVCTYAGMDSLLHLRYRTIADSIGASISPVGALWNALRTQHPGIDLYDPDESHPTLAGSYAAACSFYAVLFQKNPALVTYNPGLDTHVAGRIKRMARDVVFDSLGFWNVTPAPTVSFPLLVNEVLYDPSNSGLLGDANGDGVYDQEADSFIELLNLDTVNFDAGGLQIWDDTLSGQLKHVVPLGTLIPPGGALVVFGGGTPTGSFGGAIVQTASSSSNGLNLNNNGETIAIRDANGVTRLTFNSDALSDNPNESYTRNPDITGAFEQHSDNTPLSFSPGTRIDGTPFNTVLFPPNITVPGVDSVSPVNFNQGSFRAWFAPIAMPTARVEFKATDEGAWRSKNILDANSGSQLFNISPSYGKTVEIRLAVYNGVAWVFGPVSSFEVDCKPFNMNVVVQQPAFCAGDSVLLRVGYSGGFGVPHIVWSNGDTTKRTLVPQGIWAGVTVTDAAGCAYTDSLWAPALNLTGVPSNFVVTRPTPVTFRGTWSASILLPGHTLIGYRMAYRLRGTSTWTNTPLSSNTFAEVNFTGSGLPAGNYEFVAFARYNNGSSNVNSEFTCIGMRGYNGSGNKHEGNSDLYPEQEPSIYPNPTAGAIAVRSEIGARLVWTDVYGRHLIVQVAHSPNTAFDLGFLPNGVYLVSIEEAGGMRTERVVKVSE